ncbi:hypothetical protein [Streptomyces sp. NPDC007929]|uniref:hypothetical protein n=1 Tax=unclassified Streptomyces TaxID=2593676 RepID=UPI0036E8912E
MDPASCRSPSPLAALTESCAYRRPPRAVAAGKLLARIPEASGYVLMERVR